MTVARRAALPRILTALALAALAVMTGVQARRALFNGGADLRGYLAVARALLAGGYHADAWVNSWPPFFALFAAPLAWLARAVPNMPSFLALVFLGNLALSAGVVVLCVRAASPGTRPGAGACAATALCAAPYLRENLWFHQIGVLLLAMCAAAFARLGRRRDDALAGSLVGLAASIKVQPALLVPYLWRRPRALAAALAAGLACALAPALAYGPTTLWRAWRFWLREAIPAHLGGFGISIPAVAHNVAAALAGASPLDPLPRRPGAEYAGSALAFLTLAALCGWVARRARRGAAQPAMLDLAVLLPAAVLASPLAWRYHLVALIPAQAALVVYLSAPGGDGRRRTAALLLGLGVALGYASELGAVRELGPAVERLQALGMVVAAAAATVAALVVARDDVGSAAFTLAAGGATAPARSSAATACPASAARGWPDPPAGRWRR